MFHSNRTTRTFRANVTRALCGALLTTGAMAANPRLQTIDVTPAAKTISVGQKQYFKATGTFSNGSKQLLGPSIGNFALGYSSTCALLSGGGLECWGLNDVGQLGDGNRTPELVPSLIPRPVKGITNATAVAVHGQHACALLASGQVRCWGFNWYGELGNGTVNWSTPAPVAVLGIGTATAVTVGAWDSCALLATGAVQCWGGGQSGDGEDTSIPVSVTGIATATALTSGHLHNCALLASRSVQCWGLNDHGDLGNGTTTSSNAPVTVSAIGSATAIAAGDRSTCALLLSGVIKCWGLNDHGQLGNGSNSDSNIPVPVIGISTATAITAGGLHYCALLRDGSATCWGHNGYGQLGDGTTTDSSIPVRVGAIAAPVRLDAGYFHTCALRSGGAMICWGYNYFGQLGNRRETGENPNPLPVTVVGTPGVMWKCSDPSKATIGQYGVAIGRAAGNTTITATTLGLINDNAVLTVK